MSAHLWAQSWRADPQAVPLADRHYNRQKIGAPQFAPPGRALVLRRGESALWITSYPFARYVKHAWAGAWVCSLFRDEAPHPKVVQPSALILGAVAATRWYYGEPPEHGMITFVDAGKTRRKRDPGRCFRKAGFVEVGRTKTENLVVLQLALEAMPPAEPAWGMHERHRDFVASIGLDG